MNDILPIIIVVVGLLVAVAVYFLVKKGFDNTNIQSSAKIDSSKMEVEVCTPYVSEECMKFLDYLHRALTVDFIAFPNVGVDNLCKPKKDKVAYNAIMSNYVDICIFIRKTMQPIMIIDLVTGDSAASQYKSMDQNVIDVFKTIKLPIVQIEVEAAYDLQELRSKLIDKMPEKAFAYIKSSVK